MVELEREYTFLINSLPADIDKFPSKIIEDNYIPANADHPVIRIRRNGEKYVITKKYPENSSDELNGDSSRMVEHTIELSLDEYKSLNLLPGKRFKKRRFNYEINGYNAEVDIYLGDLSGLVVIDFEFESDEAMATFQKPDFVGSDVTQDSLVAGGMLCGKSYADIAKQLLSKYNYQPVKSVDKFEEQK